MNRITSYISANWLRLLAVVVIVGIAVIAGTPHAMGSGLLAGGMLLETTAADDILQKALAEHGQQLKGFAEKFTASLAKHAEQLREIGARLMDMEQKGARRPGGMTLGGEEKSLAEIIVTNEATGAFLKGHSATVQFDVPFRALKTAIMNPTAMTTGDINPLSPADRRPGIVTAPERRLFVRDLLAAVPTQSGIVEVATESSFTDNAAVQGQGSSPAESEGQAFNESAMGFSLTQVGVKTIGHWIPVSRQALGDSQVLAAHIDRRLLYGLALKEETQVLSGDGTGGNISGLTTEATAYNQGASNDTQLDTLAKAIAQLALSEYECSAFVVHPSDWLAMRLLKDNQNRYILGDPAELMQPALWGLPVVVTNSMTAGEFVALDARRAGYLVDRELANIRISESHSDFFVRGLAAVLAEERTALVIERGDAIIFGSYPTT